MHFHKSEVLRGISLNRWNIRRFQACLRHGFSHADALVIALRQPFGIKFASEGTAG